MHVLDLIYCSFQFFFVSPRFASSFRKCASVSTSLKAIQKTHCTVHMHQSRKEQRNNFQPTWAFPASPVPSLAVLSLEEGWPAPGWQGKVGWSTRPRGWAGCGRQQQGQGPQGWVEGWPQLQLSAQRHPPLLKGANSALLLLSSSPRACPLRFSQHPTCFVDLGQNILELHRHLQHWYFCYFFSMFLRTHWNTIFVSGVKIAPDCIMQLAYHEAVSHTYLRKNVC